MVVVGGQSPGAGAGGNDSVAHPCGIAMPISRGITHSVGALVIVCHWCATACSHRISSQTRGGCWWLSERLGVRYGVCVSSLTEIQSLSCRLLARLSSSGGGIWLRRRVLYRPLFSRSRLNRLLNQAQRFKNPLFRLEDCSSEVAPKRRIFFKTLLKLRVGNRKSGPAACKKKIEFWSDWRRRLRT